MSIIITLFVTLACLCQLFEMWYLTIPIVIIAWIYVNYIKM